MSNLTISGDGINSFYPLDPQLLTLISAVYLPLIAIALVFWSIIFMGLVKSRAYNDPNQLLIISFGVSDMILAIVSAFTFIELCVYNGHHGGFSACAVQAYFITVGICASGMSVVVIAVDRALLMCYGFMKSWEKTIILLLVAWGASLVFPGLLLFTTLPNSVLLSSGFICIANFTSRDPATRVWLILALCMLFVALATVVASYAAVLNSYITAHRRRFRVVSGLQGGVDEEIAVNLRRLLTKFALISGVCYLSFLPLIISFIYMLTTNSDSEWPGMFACITFLLLGPAINPVLIYNLDKGVQRTVNEMLGIKFKKKETTFPNSSGRLMSPSNLRVHGTQQTSRITRWNDNKTIIFARLDLDIPRSTNSVPNLPSE